MELTIDDETNIYRRGDHYYIPDGVLHSAKFTRKTWLMDYFADPDRYLPRQ
jgi:quercetin dioxygenase-like cupin family protein